MLLVMFVYLLNGKYCYCYSKYPLGAFKWGLLKCISVETIEVRSWPLVSLSFLNDFLFLIEFLPEEFLEMVLFLICCWAFYLVVTPQDSSSTFLILSWILDSCLILPSLTLNLTIFISLFDLRDIFLASTSIVWLFSGTFTMNGSSTKLDDLFTWDLED